MIHEKICIAPIDKKQSIGEISKYPPFDILNRQYNIIMNPVVHGNILSMILENGSSLTKSMHFASLQFLETFEELDYYQKTLEI